MINLLKSGYKHNFGNCWMYIRVFLSPINSQSRKTTSNHKDEDSYKCLHFVSGNNLPCENSVL